MYPDQFIQELGRSLNLPDLAFNDDHVCRLVLNDEFAIDLEWVGEPPAVHIYSVVHQRASDLEDRLAELLAANLFGRGTGGATLAFDPAANEILLMRRVESGQLQVDGFVGQLDRFARTALDWTARLARSSGLDAPHIDSAPVNHMTDGLLRV